jgi:hypothetical protein
MRSLPVANAATEALHTALQAARAVEQEMAA